MQFERKGELLKRGSLEQRDPLPIEGLMISSQPVASWDEEETCYGHDLVSLRPGVLNGVHVFLQRKTWIAGMRYSCPQIAEEEILSLEEGIKLAVENGQWTIFSALEKAEL